VAEAADAEARESERAVARRSGAALAWSGSSREGAIGNVLRGGAAESTSARIRWGREFRKPPIIACYNSTRKYTTTAITNRPRPTITASARPVIGSAGGGSGS